MSSVELFFEDEVDETEHAHLAAIRRSLRDASNPMEMENRNFVENFRLSKAAFLDLLEDIGPKLKPIRSQRAVPNILKLAALLRFCAHGSYQLSVGNDFNLGLAQPTVSLILSEIVNVMENHICPKWIKFEYTEEEKRMAKIYFFQKSSIPNVIGCLDGTHIKIVCPKKQVRHLYYNSKGFYSLNAMIMCDHMMYIRYINAKYPGASHDSSIWNMSALRLKISKDYRNGHNDFRLLGDGSYPLAPYLLTPYRNAEAGSLQSTFNKKHEQGRNIVQRMFCVLKSRFRCLLTARELHYTPEKATQIVNVCAALHNICVRYAVENPEIDNIEQENNDDAVEDILTDDTFDEGRRIRDMILSFM